jgi:hypothetical protein
MEELERRKNKEKVVEERRRASLGAGLEEIRSDGSAAERALPV